MVRRGWWKPLVLVAALLAAPACRDGGDGGDGDAAPTTAPRTPPTLPADVAAGRGSLVLGDRGFALTVRACSLEPFTDPATGVTTEMTLDADDGTGTLVAVTRASVPGDLATTTESVVVTEVGGAVLEAQRVERGGTLVDLRAPGSITPLLDVSGGLVRAAGVFGPPGTTDTAPGLVEGALIARCP